MKNLNTSNNKSAGWVLLLVLFMSVNLDAFSNTSVNNGRQSAKDSLYGVWNSSKSKDNVKMDAIISLSKLYARTQPDSAFYYSTLGVGNSTTFKSYSGVDTDPQYGVSYYRLKQTDYDGQYAYSNVVSVNCNFGSGTFNHQIYPNPASSALNILVDERSNDPISVSIYSITGQLVHQQTDINTIGTSELKIDLTNLSNGAYMLVLKSGNDQSHRFKFIKGK